MNGPVAEVELDLKQLWQALFRRKWLIISFCFVAAITALIASRLMTPIYEATTTVLVRETNPVGLQSILAESMGGSGKSDIQRSVEVFKSRHLALKTAEALGYDWDEYSPGLDSFRSRISVQPNAGSDLLKISVQHEDPVEAQQIANMLVSVFIDLTQAINSEDVRNARAFVGEQLTKFEANLAEAEEALARYKEEVSIVVENDGSDHRAIGGSDALLEALIRLESLRAEAWVNKEAAEQRLSALQGALLEDNRSALLSAAVSDNSIITGIRTRLVTLEAELAAAGEQYTERHPTVLSLKAQISELHRELDKEIYRLEASNADVYVSEEVVGMQAEIIAETARMDALDHLIVSREKLLGDLPARELVLTRLAREALVTESIYTMLLTRFEEMRITEAMEAANVNVLDAAIIPRSAVKPRTKLNVAIAGFLGLFVGIGLALLLEYTDMTFKDIEDVEDYLGLPVFGRIPSYDQRRTTNR